MLPHFLLIVMWLHYLSMEVITAHLLSPLPVSDRSLPLLVSAVVYLQVVELLTLYWSRIHCAASSSLNGKGSYLGLAAL